MPELQSEIDAVLSSLHDAIGRALSG